MIPTTAILLLPFVAFSIDSASPTASVPPAEDAPSQAPKALAAPRLERFERLLGDWKASGTFTDEDGEKQTFETSFRFSRDLDGQIVRMRQESRISGSNELDLAESFFGFDDHEGVVRRVSFRSSDPGAATSSVQWLDDNTMVEYYTEKRDGTKQLSRCTWSFVGDRIEWSRQDAAGTGSFEEAGRAVGKRSDGASLAPASAPSKRVSLPEGMDQLATMVGDFDVNLFVADAGADNQSKTLRGDLRTELDLDRRVVMSHWHFTEDNSAGIMVYYATRNAGEYAVLDMNNKGHFETSPAEFVGPGKMLIYSRSHDEDGWQVARTRREVRPDGSQLIERFRIASIDGAPVLRLQASLTPKK